MSEVTVVIGAGSIGQAIARRVSAGKHVLVADLHQGNVGAAAEVMGNAGFEVTTATVDVSSRESLQTLVETATRLGEVTGVIPPPGSHPARRRRRRSWPSTCTEPPCCSRSSATSSPTAAPGSSSPRSPGTVWAP